MEEYSDFFDNHIGAATMELYNRIDWDWFFTGSTSNGVTCEGLEVLFRKFRSLAANLTRLSLIHISEPTRPY